FSISMGNLFTAAVNHYMVRPLNGATVEVGSQTWVHLANASAIVPGQKIDFDGRTGVYVVRRDGKTQSLEGTFLVGSVDGEHGRVSLLNAEDRTPTVTRGSFDAQHAEVSTYAL